MCRYLFHIKLSGRLVGQQQPWRRITSARREITSLRFPLRQRHLICMRALIIPLHQQTLLSQPSGAFSPISRANQGTRSEGFASLVTLCDLPHYNAGFPIDRHILLRPRNIPSHRLSMVQPSQPRPLHLVINSFSLTINLQKHSIPANRSLQWEDQ